MAHQYASKLTLDAENVAALYNRVFAQREDISVGEEPQEDASDQITFNARQRIVIVAEAFSGEMEQTLRYLRARLGVDISAVRFNVHRLELETLLETEILVGRESTGQVKAAGGSSKPTTNHDEIRAKVTTDFLRNQVDGLEEWLASVSPRMTVRHHKETNHSISLNGRTMGGYYFAVNWIHFWLKGRVEGDEGALARLSLPTSVLTKPDLVSGNVASESDLEIYKAQLMARVSSLNEVGKRLDE